MRNGKQKLVVCIHRDCPRLGLRYSIDECLPKGHYGVVTREGDWPTQATGGYWHSQLTKERNRE